MRGDLVPASRLPSTTVVELVQRRCEARASRNYAAADALKERLEAGGVKLQDCLGGGTTWEYSVSRRDGGGASPMTALARTALESHTDRAAVSRLSDEALALCAAGEPLLGRVAADAAFDFALAGCESAPLLESLAAAQAAEFDRWRRPQPLVSLQEAPPRDADADAALALALGGFDDPRLPLVLDLGEHGFVVFSHALTVAECEHALDGLWAWLEGLGTGVERRRPDTWDDERWPRCVEGGILPFHGIGCSEFMWRIRSNANVRAAFAAVWGVTSDDLITSLDGAAAFRPWRRRPERRTRGGWLHVDQNPARPEFECVQGLVHFGPATSHATGGNEVIRRRKAAVRARVTTAHRPYVFQPTHEYSVYCDEQMARYSVPRDEPLLTPLAARLVGYSEAEIAAGEHLPAARSGEGV
ncbi:hypothetical protein EMIHUDRAFT_227300 [Emiliania huxleyi CCMP1516]|uniref:Uncharacterized protein n=2 Tax=Emiliania huxleyi TaxID=2903 RepID=A0A0D3KJ23_EMIH1|nr:hypothetical protein EMIHUDRAFT_227300 [Emiliania huxleyi CCMP1516]EOD35758.1 hypothetical protein EMIHUDRAFT_227300 [Emiliania huxleyi CCMP1516]|eukprot:XP_005788187.1 hypothetical protein EMIHUDRAFT_227300 [Emiliania huxleyi CCMP1516]